MEKKNFLLVMPRIVNKIGDGYSFPLGLPYISAALKKAGFRIVTCNLNHRKGTVEDVIRELIREHQIDVVLTGGLSFQYYPIRELVESVKKIASDIPIIVGGGVITGDPEAAMRALNVVDIGVIGEGEITDVELCRALENGTSLDEVDGLIIKRRDQSLYRTRERKEIDDIDSIPWPDYDGFELEKSFDKNPGVSGLNYKRTIFMLGSRSCPYRCSFCFHTVGKKYRQRSLDNFFEELEYNIKRYGIDFVCIADELFSYNNERVTEFCSRIKEYNIGWWAQFRVDSIDPWLLPLLKESGCKTMSFGLESADNRVLKSMGKYTTIEQIDRTLRQVYEAGISFEGAFIFGDEAESYETASNTLKYWEENSEFKINLNVITVFPGCPLYKNAIRKGLIKDPVSYLKNGCPQFNNTKMTIEEYSDIMKKIAEYPFSKTYNLTDVELLGVDYHDARVDIRGECPKCRTKTRWDEIKLFATNFLSCSGCGQRYNISVPKPILSRIDANIRKLVEKYGNIAIWGMNYHTTKLFEDVGALGGERIFPVDVSQIKQHLTVSGRSVCDPQVIKEKDIRLVVIAIPAYYNQIELQIKYEFSNVEKVLDICDLIQEDFLF